LKNLSISKKKKKFENKFSGTMLGTKKIHKKNFSANSDFEAKDIKGCEEGTLI